MESNLLNKILTDENYGKGLIELPEGTVVPSGKVTYYSFLDERGGAGIMQSTIVYRLRMEYKRSEDGNYYYSYYLMSEGKETDETYLVPESLVAVVDRLVRNTCLAGCGNLKHDYIPGLISPINSPTPIYNMKLALEDANGQTTDIPLSSFDISSNGGNDLINSFFTLFVSIRSTGTLIPKEPVPEAPAPTGPWTCTRCSNINTGFFCINCGEKRPG